MLLRLDVYLIFMHIKSSCSWCKQEFCVDVTHLTCVDIALNLFKMNAFICE